MLFENVGVGNGDGASNGRPQELVTVNSQRLAVKVLVGAGARLLFYPTLCYNVVRNKLESEFRWWDEIEQFLLLGAVPFWKDVRQLKSLGVEAVVTLNESYETLVSTSHYESQRIKHLVIPTRDYLFAPSFDDIERAIDFIHENVEQRRAVYVHCKAGRGRSTTVVICYLVKYRGLSPVDAFNYIRSKRPRVLLAGAQWKAVLKFSEYQHLGGEASSNAVAALPQQWAIYKHLQAGDEGVAALLSRHNTPCCGEVPVFVTLSDLEGYQEIKAGKLGGKFKVVYKVGVVTARSVVGLAKASLTVARLSCIWIGLNATQTDDVGKKGITAYHSMVSMSVCQQGLVAC